MSDKEAAYEDAWNRMIKSLQGLNVEQAKIRDAASGGLRISLDGTVTALEMVIAKMQEIQARIEAGE